MFFLLNEKDLKTEKEFELHMKTHSYKRVDFKCEDCEFCGENELTMQVRLGKKHGEKFECGLCGFVANNLENRDIHLFTCEIYICLKRREWNSESETTEIRLKSLPAMKEHLLDGEQHCYDNYFNIIHAKQDMGKRRNINACDIYTARTEGVDYHRRLSLASLRLPLTQS